MMLILAALLFVFLFLIIDWKAPYGRHNREGWGPQINAKLGWIIMESPAVIVFTIAFIIGDHYTSFVPILFLLMWQTHYIHRTYIFPLQMHSGQQHMTLLVISMGFIFNSINGYLNGSYLSTFGPEYSLDWLIDPRFIIGFLVFGVGFAINRHSDNLLRNLRKPGERDYKIPRGGFFKLVSCANYFGEIIQWYGWAIATWSLPGILFAVWTTLNLFPRARAHHTWYQDQFPDYPQHRRALIPYIY